MTVIAQDDHLTAGAWAACDWMDEYCLYLLCPLTTIRRIQPFSVFSMSSTGRTKFVKTQFVPRTISLESYRVHWGVFKSTVKNFAFISIANDRPILSPAYSMK